MENKLEFLRRSLKKSTKNEIQMKLVKGKSPDWLNGIYFRDGPGRYEFSNNRSYEHMFDGQACIQKFRIKNGDVFYTNRLLDTKSYTKTVTSTILYPNFGKNEELRGVWNFLWRLIRFYQQVETNDNVNINLCLYANSHLYALSETNRFCRIDPINLDIIHTVDIKNYISSIMTTIAHPHIDKDGSWITCGLNPLGFAYEFIKYDVLEDGSGHDICSQNARVVTSFPTSHWLGLSYFHSYGITDNFIIFLEQSLVLSYWHLFVAIFKNNPISNCFKTNKNFETRIHLADKHTGKIYKQRFKTIPQFSFHYLNCFEVRESDETLRDICIDVCSYNIETFDIENFTYENLYSGKFNGSNILKSLARRITVPMNLEHSTNEIYCEIKDLNPVLPFELPVINYLRFNGKPYRYVYGVSYYNVPFAIVKMNVHDPDEPVKEQRFNGKNNDLLMPSEPVFVQRDPTDENCDEDDGVLLVMVLSSKKNDYLSILDAKTLKEIAKYEMEKMKFAFSFHGFYANSMIHPKVVSK